MCLQAMGTVDTDSTADFKLYFVSKRACYSSLSFCIKEKIKTHAVAIIMLERTYWIVHEQCDVFYAHGSS